MYNLKHDKGKIIDNTIFYFSSAQNPPHHPEEASD